MLSGDPTTILSPKGNILGGFFRQCDSVLTCLSIFSFTDIFHCLRNHPEDAEIEFESYIRDTPHDFRCIRCSTPHFICTLDTMSEMLKNSRI